MKTAMNSEELLQTLKQKVESGEMTREQIMTQLNFDAKVSAATQANTGWQWSFSKILYFLGGLVVLAGVLFLVGQIWEDLGSFGRIFITLGLGLMFAGSGSFLWRSDSIGGKRLGSVFHVIGGLLIPSGTLVMLDELFLSTGSPWPVATVFGVMTIWYAVLNAYHKHVLLAFFALANGTIFLYAFMNALVDESLITLSGDTLNAYLTMFIGLGYLLCSQAFQHTRNEKLVSWLNLFGTLGFFGAAFSRVFDSGFWQVLFVLLVAGGVVWAVLKKSRAILAVSTCFLLAHLSYITGAYFADSIGWPIALIVLGFLFIGLGYASLSISKKYIH
jgi:hypothetical protein